MNPSGNKKILFASTPADGHFYPLTALAKHLQSIGYEVRWYASATYAGKLQQLGISHFPFRKAVDVNAEDLDFIFPERRRILSPIKKVNWDMIHFFILRAPEYLADIASIQKEFPFGLLIADNTFTGLPLVKEILKVPVMAVGVTPLGETSIDLPPNGLGMVPSTSWFGKLKQRILRFAAIHLLFNKPNKVLHDILEEHGIDHKDQFIFDYLAHTADLYLQSGTPGFEYYRSDLGKNVRFIGGLLPYMNNANPNIWFDERLNKYKKIVVVTQGTIEKDIDKLLVPTLEAFKGTDTLVICTTGGSQTALLKAKYPQDNIILSDFIPFADVMPYADVFISNGGYGGVVLAVENELPMVVAGIHEGKNEICARVGYFEYGINLKTDNPKAKMIFNAVNEVLANPVYKEQVSKLAEEFTQYNPYELCARYVAELLQEPVAENAGMVWEWEVTY